MGTSATIAILTTLNGVAAAGSAVLAAVAWRRRRTGVMAVGLVAAMTAVAVWTASDCLIALSVVGWLPAGVGRAAAMVIFPASSTMVAGFWWLSRALLNPAWRITRRKVAIFMAEPLFITVAAATDFRHHALFRFLSAGPDDLWIRLEPQWLFWCHCAFLYAMLAANLVILLAGVRHAGHMRRRQARWILCGALVPVAVSAVTLQYAGDLPDMTALAFVITSLVFFRAVFGEGLLRVIPVARSLVFDRLRDAVIVTDGDGRLADLNLAGDRLIAEAAPDLSRRPGAVVGPTLRALGLPQPVIDGEYRVRLPDGLRVFEVRVERLADHRGRATASVALVRDVTEVARQRDALTRTNQRLREQVETNELLRAKLSEQASRDELTGLHNRRHLMTQLQDQIEYAVRDESDLCAVLLDVDHFKSVNDRHGHAVGDDLLRGIAAALAEVVAEPGVVARYGGEEFVLLLPGEDLAGARARAEQVRRRCAAVTVPSPAGPIARTVSMGVASLATLRRTSAVDPACLLKAADTALYRAKAAGRDQVVCAEPENAGDLARG
ncbi:diguanylate cyclase [Actinoplanes sp. NPDC049802]|uniref:histidine kinase N-terminal 7TM domain-containing diguanylate cyclase n=1 Tax=Actinoplanes sp. NPDC049802 TaxID=3154742 RepID=UPI00340CA7CF